MNKTNVTYLSAVRYAITELSKGGVDPEDAEVVAKLNALADALEKRAHAIRKPTTKQKQAAEARDGIPGAMEPGKRYTATEIGKLFGQSSQWASPKVNALANAGVLVKSVEKGRSYFTLAE